MDSILVFVSGSSGSGKNTIINALIAKNKGYKFLVSNTTREKRPSDKRVGQYHFLTKEEFEGKIAAGEMLEYDMYNGNYYGLDKEEELGKAHDGKVLLKDITVKGVLNSMEVLAGKIKQVNLFVTEKKKVLKRRLIERGEKRENIKNRLKLYNNEQKMARHYDYILYNTSLDRSCTLTQAVINTEFNNLPILSNVSTQRISVRRIEKVANRLRKGKNVKPVEVTVFDDRIYIVKGANTYLASLSTGLNIPKLFVNKTEKLNLTVNNDEWLKVVDNYRK